MATTAEINAAIASAEAKGRKDLADKLRARLSEASDAAKPTRDPATIEAAIANAEAKGRKDLADKLRAYLPAAAPAYIPAPQAQPSEADLAAQQEAAAFAAMPPAAPSPEDERQSKVDDLALFEMANPELRGRYAVGDKLPKAGESVMGKGGGGRSGGARITVQPWREADIRKQGSFGDTAAAMMEGPVAGMKAFGAGLMDTSKSPSYEYLKNDPFTGAIGGNRVGDAILGTASKFGDAGGAALSAIGAGLSGVIGLGSELVPGQDQKGERKFAEDVTGMSMFAVPELAGASSIPARVAAAAPKAAPVAKAAGSVADDVAAAERLGVPVMRSDVKPPKTFIGGVAQKTGESIPIAGTGGQRAAQNTARIEAAQNFARQYGAENIAPAIDDVTAGLLEKRSGDLKKYTKQKKEVIEGLSDKGDVPVPKATAAIDEQIAKLRKQNMAGLEPVIAKLEEFKASIAKQKLTEIEANRAVIGEAFSGLDMGSIRSVGEKALSAIYAPLRDDMAAFIKSVGGQTALNKWGSANAKLSEMAGELGNTALKRSLSKGEATPETVRTLLFSGKPSDVKLLYKNLDEKGRASARTAVVQEALAKAGGIDELSPDKFKQALGKMGNQVGVFFKGEDFEAADGLLRVLKLTERAGKAGVTPLTGVQNVPAVVGILVSSFFGGSIPATAGALGTIGGIARIYEATGVKSALRAIAKAETPKARGDAMQTLGKALEGAGVPSAQAAATEAANGNAAPDYEALWGRY